MNEPGKSDKPVVPMKSAKMDYWEFHQQFVKWAKGRDLAKENAENGQAALRPAASRAFRSRI
jgi:hypothetical protein